MASPGRVQVREFQREAQLAPAPVVNVQSVAPVNRQGEGSNLLRIADSLASFGNSVTRYGMSSVALGERQRVEADRKKNEAEREARKTAGAYSLYTFDEISKARKENPALDSDAMDAVQGRALGIEFQNSVFQETIGDPNWDGNAEVLRQRALEYAKEKGLNEIGMAAYSAYLDGLLQSVQNARNNEMAKAKMTEQVTAAERVAQNHGQTILQLELQKAGSDPLKQQEAYKKAAAAQLKELRDALPGWATNEDKQKSDLRAVEAAVASGDKQLLDALLADDRGGVGALGNITALQPNIEVWRAKADANFREKNKVTGLEFENEAYRLLENPNTTFEQVDEWAKRAAPYIGLDAVGAFKNRFTTTQINLNQKRAAVAQNEQDKKATIGATVGWLMTGEGPGGTFLMDGAEITSDSDVNAKTTLSPETVKKETVNALKGMAEQEFPGDVHKQTVFLVPRLKQGDLTMPEHTDAINRLIMANPTQKLKEGLNKQDDEALAVIESLVTTGELPYLNKITPDGGKTFVGVLQSKLEAGINPRQALRDTYSIMAQPDKAAKARVSVDRVEMGWDNNESLMELMDNSPQGEALLKDKLYQMALGDANVYDPDVRKAAAETVKKNHVQIGKAFVPKNIVGWGANTGDDIKAYVEDLIPKIGPKMVPPVDNIDELSIRQTADGFVFIDTNTGLPLMQKSTKGGVSSSELLTIRKEDVDAFRKLRNDRASIPAETYKEKLTKATGREEIVYEDVIHPRGGQVYKRPRKLTPEEIVKRDEAKAAEERKAQQRADREKPRTPQERIMAARSFFVLDPSMSDEDVIKFLRSRNAWDD